MDKSSRRPPPPPPDSNTLPPVPPPPRDPAAPPLPRRNQAPPPTKETPNDFYEDMSPPKAQESSDDTYEIPEVNSKPEPRLPPRPDTGVKPIARPSPPESDSDDGEWDEEWDDAQTDPKQGDGLYIVPDGGNVEEDLPSSVQHVEDNPAPPPPPPNNRRRTEQQQQANVQQLNSKAPITPPTPPHKPAQTPMAAELREKLSIFQNSKPVPPPKTDKPQPPAKPVEIKPHLPPRSHEKLPPVPPIDATDGKSDDNSSEGSTSSGTTPSSKPLKMNSPSGQVIRNQAKVLVFPAVHATIKKLEEQVSKFPSKLPNQVSSEPDEIYDDATTENLTSYAWYHGELDRKEAEKRVSQLRENGAYLVRASTKADPTNPYVLVVLSEGKIKNLQLRQRNDKRFAIGNYKQDEVSFNTVPDLVNHHKTNNIKLADGGTVMLTQTPQKQYRD